MKTIYFSHFHNIKSANIFNLSLSSFNYNFPAIISSVEFRSERSRAWNFRSTFDPSKNRAIFFSSISISILVKRVNFRAIRAKFRAILCLVSTLIWSLCSYLCILFPCHKCYIDYDKCRVSIFYIKWRKHAIYKQDLKTLCQIVTQIIPKKIDFYTLHSIKSYSFVFKNRTNLKIFRVFYSL